MPGKESSGSRGRGGRCGGFGRGRGRGRGGGGNFGCKQERAATFNSSSPQQEPAEELCHICVTLGHKGRYAIHAHDSCPNKAKYERQMRDPEKLARLVQRLALRLAEQETSGSASAKSQPTPTQPQPPTAPPPAQHPPLPVSEYRFPYQHHVPPWNARAGHMGAAGSFAPPTFVRTTDGLFTPVVGLFALVYRAKVTGLLELSCLTHTGGITQEQELRTNLPVQMSPG